MSTATNGNAGRYPTRRLRFDASSVRLAGSRNYPMIAQRSGRRFIVVALLTVALLWGALYVLFRDWRVRFLERATYGRNEVATAVDPLAKRTPANINSDDWRDAVAETHEMILTVTGSNLLDFAELKRLRAELRARVADARPETARAELEAIWDDLEARAGHIIDRHKRPKLLQKSVPQQQAPK